MFEVLRTVFVRPSYVLLAIVVAWIVFSTAIWLPNMALIVQILTSLSASLIEKITFLFSLYGGIGTNFTTLSAIYTILIALLFGMNIAMMAFYVRKQRSTFASAESPVFGAGFGGLISGFLGIGCATCGTFVLTSLLGLFSAGALLTFLPLNGEEFGILGVGLLGYSSYVLSKKIKEPGVCAI